MDFIYIPSELDLDRENGPIFSLDSPSVHSEERVKMCIRDRRMCA